ncbi:protein of unknown function [Burkholderia multivorans]
MRMHGRAVQGQLRDVRTGRRSAARRRDDTGLSAAARRSAQGNSRGLPAARGARVTRGQRCFR